MPTGRIILSVTESTLNPKRLKKATKLSVKKLKYLKKPRIIKFTAIEKISINLRFDLPVDVRSLISPNNLPAKKSMIVVIPSRNKNLQSQEP